MQDGTYDPSGLPGARVHLSHHWRGTRVPRQNTTRFRNIPANARTSGMMISAPSTAMTGLHAESTLDDMTRYVRTVQATVNSKATVSDNRLNRSTAFGFAWIGAKRKNAHPTTPTTGSRTNKAAITVALLGGYGLAAGGRASVLAYTTVRRSRVMVGERHQAESK